MNINEKGLPGFLWVGYWVNWGIWMGLSASENPLYAIYRMAAMMCLGLWLFSVAFKLAALIIYLRRNK